MYVHISRFYRAIPLDITKNKQYGEKENRYANQWIDKRATLDDDRECRAINTRRQVGIKVKSETKYMSFESHRNKMAAAKIKCDKRWDL